MCEDTFLNVADLIWNRIQKRKDSTWVACKRWSTNGAGTNKPCRGRGEMSSPSLPGFCVLSLKVEWKDGAHPKEARIILLSRIMYDTLMDEFKKYLGEAFHLWPSCKITSNPWISGAPGASIVTSNTTCWSSLLWALASASFRRNATSWPSLLPPLLKEAIYSTETNNDKKTLENIENDSKLVGGFNAFKKYELVKLDHFPR